MSRIGADTLKYAAGVSLLRRPGLGNHELGVLDDGSDRLAQIMTHILKECCLGLIGGFETHALLSVSYISIGRHKTAIRHPGSTYFNARTVGSVDIEPRRRQGASTVNDFFQLQIEI